MLCKAVFTLRTTSDDTTTPDDVVRCHCVVRQLLHANCRAGRVSHDVDIVRYRATIDAEIEPSSISSSVSLRQRTTSCGMWTAPLKMIGKGFYSKWVKSSFKQFITTQTRVVSTNGRIISQNTEILKFYFSTICGNLRNLWRHLTGFVYVGCALSLVFQCIYTVNSR